MERTQTAIRTPAEEERPEALLLLQVRRQDTSTIDRSAAISTRGLKFVVLGSAPIGKYR